MSKKNSEGIVNFKETTQKPPQKPNNLSSRRKPPSLIVLTMKWGQLLPPIMVPLGAHRAGPGTQGGLMGPELQCLVSGRNVGSWVAPGLGSAILYSCALRQGGNSKKMGTREEKQCGETLTKDLGILWKCKNLLK